MHIIPGWRTRRPEPNSAGPPRCLAESTARPPVQLCSGLSDRALLVRREHQDVGLRIPSGDVDRAHAVARDIDAHAQPSRSLADALAHGGRVLADAGREDEGVEAAQGCGEGADLAADAVDEEVYRFSCMRIAAVEQGLHVSGNARNAEQAGLLIKQ